MPGLNHKHDEPDEPSRKNPKRRLDVRRAVHGATACGGPPNCPICAPVPGGRALVIGDIVEFLNGEELNGPLWSRLVISPATIGLDGLKPEDFGKTWRWLRIGDLPEIGNEIEVYKETHTSDGCRVGAWVRAWPDSVIGQPTHHFHISGTWFGLEAKVLSAADEGPLWRWPIATPEAAPATPEAAPATPAISLEDHHARLFTVHMDNALAAVVALNRVQTLRTLIIRIAHDASTLIINQSKESRLLQDAAFTFSRNIFFASMEATEQLQKENAAMHRSVQHLDDCYKMMSECLKPLFAATKLRDFIKHEVVAANPERVKVWQYFLRVWETINPHAVQMVRSFIENPDDSVELVIEKCFAVAK